MPPSSENGSSRASARVIAANGVETARPSARVNSRRQKKWRIVGRQGRKMSYFLNIVASLVGLSKQGEKVNVAQLG